MMENPTTCIRVFLSIEGANMTLINTVVQSRDSLRFHLSAGLHPTVSPDPLIVFAGIVYGNNEPGAASRQSNESDQWI